MNNLKNIKGLEILLGYRCNLKCTFCYQKNLRTKFNLNMSKNNVIYLLQKGIKNGKKIITFSGGEPTLDENLPYYVEYAHKIGYKYIRIHSNGYKISNEKYLKNLYNKGLTGLVLSIHGYKEIHDLITGVEGSFKLLIKSLILILKLKKEDCTFTLDINVVVCKANYKTLDKLFKFLSFFLFNRIQVSFPYSLNLFSDLEISNFLVRFNDLKDQINNWIKRFDIGKKDFVFEKIPYCIIESKYWKYILSNVKISQESYNIHELTGKIEERTQTIKEVYEYYPKNCNLCKIKKICPGVHKEYINLYGDSEFIPII